MGRRIYADTVGIDPNDNFVHKFWFGVQSSDVEDYLEQWEDVRFYATLDTKDEPKIKAKVKELKDLFKATFGTPYSALWNKVKDGYAFSDEPPRDQMELGARIQLGLNLLKTIENMKAKDIQAQDLDIEV